MKCKCHISSGPYSDYDYIDPQCRIHGVNRKPLESLANDKSLTDEEKRKVALALGFGY